jgi:hypothetical protein
MMKSSRTITGQWDNLRFKSQCYMHETNAIYQPFSRAYFLNPDVVRYDGRKTRGWF